MNINFCSNQGTSVPFDSLCVKLFAILQSRVNVAGGLLTVASNPGLAADRAYVLS